MEAVLDRVDVGEDLQNVPPPEITAEEKAAQAFGKGEGNGADKTDDAGKDGGKEAKGVPHAALHEAREHIKQLKAQIGDIEKQPRLSKDDQELLSQLKAEKKAAGEPKDPDFLSDPKAYIDAKEKRAVEALDRLEKGQQHIEQNSKQQAEFQQLLGNVQQQEASFVKETPDYFDALNHVRQVRAKQLQIVYPDATSAQISQAISQEEIALAAQALRSGRNPALVAYENAKTLNYMQKATEKDKAGEKVVALADKSAARTLGGSGGGDQSDPSDTEDTMPDFTAALRERFGKRK